MGETEYKVYQEDCAHWLKTYSGMRFHLSFVDPPFNQGKDYKYFDDDQKDEDYWQWLKGILLDIQRHTVNGGAIYFMQREKNAEYVLQTLRETGWVFQNLIIWKKKTSAVPFSNRFGKHYQIIAFATKGKSARVFNKLRISPPLPQNYKYERENGVFVTDVWDDIRELTSGYFAGDEAIRDQSGERFHKQQTPIALILRIILSSTNVGDIVFDPFADTGTTLVVAYQLRRKAIGIEIDPDNVSCIYTRLSKIRAVDNIQKYYQDYSFTEDLERIWGSSAEEKLKAIPQQEHLPLFEE